MSHKWGIVAIVRLREHVADDAIVEALMAGGVAYVEVTLPSPQAEETVSRWSELDDIITGAGTVRTAEHASRAIEAGAQFLVTPTVNGEVLEIAREGAVPLVCGASTPTEIDVAGFGGAAAVKVFPAAQLGGPEYIRAVRDPLDDVALLPTGGIGVADVAPYVRAGSAGLGVGSQLISEGVVARRAWPELRDRALSFVRAWEKASSDA